MPGDEGGRLRLRRSSTVGLAAMLLLLLALVLPWWSVTNDLDGVATTEQVGLLTGGRGYAEGAWVTATLVALVAPMPVLFVRVAARSWRHEPRAWRRDAGLCLASVFAALGLPWAWPVEGPFWGTRTFPLDGAGPGAEGSALHVIHAPAAGWWTTALAALLLVWAWHWARIGVDRPAAGEGAQGSGVGGGTQSPDPRDPDG